MRNANQANDPLTPAARTARSGRRRVAVIVVIAALALTVAIVGAYAAGRKQGAAAAAATTVTESVTVSPDPGSPPATSSRGAAPSSASRSSVPSARSAAPRAADDDVSSQIRLEPGYGVDLDAPEANAEEVSGPDGDIDLHFSDDLTVTASRAALFYYYGTESDAKTDCPKTVKEGRSTTGPLTPSAIGSQYCFRTSRGAYGWFNINSVDLQPGPPEDHVVINYRVGL
ncbi:hypothetical protein [Actinokineospora iranica]|uniref:Uncharacterized protein n=1 Tax=Actinokineospora iranica TaxID=1271860 RepID=A0A1G6U420_9PSEU|nr:hypothetical protein [Actinokineospora iranica]SDD36053.1 hypothetical protein SAMN05216174_11095 [Actinokineospora iranica]